MYVYKLWIPSQSSTDRAFLRGRSANLYREEFSVGAALSLNYTASRFHKKYTGTPVSTMRSPGHV